MPRNHMTDRSLRAIKTRKKLYQSAEKLIKKHGYDKVTIEDICKKANVSVGAFYHYFSSKSDIILEFFKQIDYYYEDTVETEYSGNASEDIDIYFRYYALFHVDQGIEHTSMILRIQSDFFIDKTRYMYVKLKDIIEAAKDEGVFDKEADNDLIADFLLVVARGLLFDWALTKGGHDLAAKMDVYIKLAKLSFR